MIRANDEKYSISAMCRYLNVTRSLVYYAPKEPAVNSTLENEVIKAFKDSRNNYGARKIKAMLNRQELIASRRKIAEIMRKYGLVSNYTIKKYKAHKTKVNEDKVANLVERKFDDRRRLEVVVSDLTYVKVSGKWHYICLLLDLSEREIIGSAAGRSKDAKLVQKAFYTTKIDLRQIDIFHTDRGSEFKNKIIDSLLSAFEIKRSLSKKGCPYDNAVAESMYHIVKTEFANSSFDSLEDLQLGLFDYVNWYNNVRIHGSLGYLSPAEHKKSSLSIE